MWPSSIQLGMKIILFSKFDALVEAENTSFEVLENNFEAFEFSKTERLKITPRNQNDCLPYYFDVKINGESVKVNSPYAKLIGIDKTSKFLILQKNFVCQNLENNFLSTSYNDYEVQIGQNVSVLQANKVILQKHFSAKNVEIYSKHGIVFCEINLGKKKNFLVLDESGKVLVDDFVSQVEQTLNGFQTLNILNDMQKQGVVKKYEISEKNLTLQSEYAVYIDGSPKKLTSKQCNVLAFFECVRAKNIALAKSYCSQSLASTITTGHLKYFDEFDEIFVDSDFGKVILINTNQEKADAYNVEIFNNLIENIEKIA